MIASLEALRRLRARGGKDVRKAQRTGAATHFQIEITSQNYQDIVLDLGIPERYSSSPQVVRSFFAEKFNAQADGDTVVFSIGVFSTNWHGSLR